MSRISAAELMELLSTEALEHLERWSLRDRKLFAELLEDAGSDLQRELLQRSVASGHPSGEVHAFGDAIRGMSDEEIYDACTLDEGSGVHSSVSALLRVESDPIHAFLENGHELDPRPSDDDPGPAYRAGGAPIPAALLRGPDLPRIGPRTKGFEEASLVGRAYREDPRDLGASADDEPSWPGVEGRLGEDLLNDAVKALGVVYSEQAVDAGKLKLETALESAAAALSKGIPIPVILGGAAKQYTRYALILQVQPAGKTRAYQLHDPQAHETVWANEGDLTARTELPFSDKSVRRITAIALPRK